MLLFRGRKAFVEHLITNIAIAFGGAILAWSGVFVYQFIRAPSLIQAAAVQNAKDTAKRDQKTEDEAELKRQLADKDSTIRDREGEIKKLKGRPPCRNGSGSADRISPPIFSDTEKILLTNSLKAGRGNAITIVTVGGTHATAVSSQIQDAFREAGWTVQINVIGSLNITIAGGAISGRVELEGLYLIAGNSQSPAVQTIVSSFEMSRHAVSLNGSTVLRPRGDITLYVVYGNRPPS